MIERVPVLGFLLQCGSLHKFPPFWEQQFGRTSMCWPGSTSSSRLASARKSQPTRRTKPPGSRRPALGVWLWWASWNCRIFRQWASGIQGDRCPPSRLGALGGSGLVLASSGGHFGAFQGEGGSRIAGCFRWVVLEPAAESDLKSEQVAMPRLRTCTCI